MVLSHVSQTQTISGLQLLTSTASCWKALVRARLRAFSTMQDSASRPELASVDCFLVGWVARARQSIRVRARSVFALLLLTGKRSAVITTGMWLRSSAAGDTVRSALTVEIGWLVKDGFEARRRRPARVPRWRRTSRPLSCRVEHTSGGGRRRCRNARSVDRS